MQFLPKFWLSDPGYKKLGNAEAINVGGTAWRCYRVYARVRMRKRL